MSENVEFINISRLIDPQEADTALDIQAMAFCAQLVLTTKPIIVVEAGTFKGTFTNMAQELQQNLGVFGHVYTADPICYGHSLRLNVNVSYLQDDFERLAVVYPEIVGEVNLALIDSGPPFPGNPEPGEEGWDSDIRWRHFNTCKDWMAPGGLILVDDLNARDWNHADEIAEQCGLVLTIGRGLGVWQKR